ncbi:imidazolonepropionase [Catenulispora rubra]|uniref:imidazolonepropionase n=1 Tax=Catenulispora rubra TaxID=280293 RepID=UPI0018920FB3|nr:imidazolonepropionase [Catenulispora rubra]
MTTTLLTNIAELTTHAAPGTLTDAALVIADGRVAWTGPSAQAPDADERVDLGGRAVIPGFVDSHAHLVFAGDRSQEFAARMTGTPYSAGGIRTTVAATRAASDDDLRANLKRLTGEMLRQGTTTVECKSGYGLTVEDEARALRLAREQVEAVTYLGAHVVPAEYKDRPEEYVDLVKGPMLDACAPFADYADVFCERGAFDAEQTREILTAARAKGLDLRLHANQLGNGPGVQLAVEFGAASADHCTFLDDKDIAALAGSQTVATLLPGVEFSTRSPYPDARRLLEAGATVAIATDCNPGSCYTNSMPFCIAVAVRDMHMSPAEALWAATVGGAKALRREDVGHLGVGARADFAVLDAPSHLHLAYRPGVPLVHRVWKNGTPVS